MRVRQVVRYVAVAVGVSLPVGGVWAWNEVSRFDARMKRIWSESVSVVTIETDAELIARGKHLAESLAGCATSDCHGEDLGGGKPAEFGPIGTFVGGNITSTGSGSEYSDAELMRLLKKGIKRDGTSLRFMPVQEFAWLPERDMHALIVYLRSVPGAELRQQPESHVGLLGKVLDNAGKFVVDVAGYVHEHPPDSPPPPGPTAAYGAFVARSCMSCHGERLSGGPIPGAPPNLPVPTNLTTHDTGIAHYSRSDFDWFISSGKRPNGSRVNDFMPLSMLQGMNSDERDALWAYLHTVRPLEFGNR